MAHAVPARLTPTEGRAFALTLAAAFAVLGVLAWWRWSAAIAIVPAALAAALLLAGIVAPTRLGPVQRAWMGFGLAISRVTTPLVLGALYFLVITPTGILRRRLGRSPLAPPDPRHSAWVPRARGASDLHRQF